MKFNNKENEPVATVDNKVVWQSRSVAVCALIITEDVKCLVAQRSDKVDHPNKWALPCGYIDWNESIHQALIRELWEELGLNSEGWYCQLYHVNDAPDSDPRQNITFHFIVVAPYTSNELKDMIKLCDESIQFDFIDREDIFKGDFGNKKFAFNHDERLKKTIDLREKLVHEAILSLEAPTQFLY